MGHETRIYKGGFLHLYKCPIIFKLLVIIKHLQTLGCLVLETIDNMHLIPAAGLLTESGAALPLCELCPHRLSLVAKHRPAWVGSQSIG